MTRTTARATRIVTLASLFAIVALAAPANAGTGAKTRRVNISSGGAEANASGLYLGISATGRFVVFESAATNLVPGDTNATTDVFVRDRKLGTTTRVSVRSNGRQGNGWSGYAAISGNGRFVTFWSEATNMVKGDTNGYADVFVHDRKTGVTTLDSLNTRGRQGNEDSAYGSLSYNGRFLVFTSDATNMTKNDTNGYTDIFVRDRVAGTTIRVNESTRGNQANADFGYIPPNAISASGRFVTFESKASNLVHGDTNAAEDVFVHDVVTGKTKRVSVRTNGAQANAESLVPTISPNGRFVVFEGYATNLVSGDTNGYTDIFVHDRKTGKTTRVSVSSAGLQGDLSSYWPTISGDGRLVAFESDATTLIGSDTNGFRDVYVHDRATGLTRRISVASSGAQADSNSASAYVSGDGRFVAFDSLASNLVPGDSGSYGDIFVRGPI